MADEEKKQDEYHVGQWKASGLSPEEYLKNKGIEGTYHYDPQTQSFFNPRATASNLVDRVNSGISQLTTPGVTQSPRNIAGATSNVVTYQPAAGATAGAAPSQTGLTPEATWRNTFGPKPVSEGVPFDALQSRLEWQADRDNIVRIPDVRRYAAPTEAGPQGTFGAPANPAASAQRAYDLGLGAKPVAPLSPDKINYWNTRLLQGASARPGADRTVVLNARTEEERRRLYAPR